MSHIFDDFIFLSTSESLCRSYLHSFLSVAELLALPIKHSKTVVPSKCAIVHGTEIDTVVMQARLLQDKLDSASALVDIQSTQESYIKGAAVPYRDSLFCIKGCCWWTPLFTAPH